jgi:transposase-like protein
MTSKTTNKFSSEVRARAVRMVLDHEGEHASRWAAVSSIAAKIGCLKSPDNGHSCMIKLMQDHR